MSAIATPPAAAISATTVRRRAVVGAVAADRAAEVVDDDARAALGEQQRVGPADAASGAGDDGDPSVEADARSPRSSFAGIVTGVPTSPDYRSGRAADAAARTERRPDAARSGRPARDAIVDTSAHGLRPSRATTPPASSSCATVNGLGKGAFYHYIGSKEELLAAIHDRVMDEVMVGADRVAEAGGIAVGAARHARRRAARRHPPLPRPRVGLPPRVPGAHRRAGRAVPGAPARVRAAGRGGPAGRHRLRRVPRRRPPAHRPRLARHAQLHLPVARRPTAGCRPATWRSRSPTSSSAGSPAEP